MLLTPVLVVWSLLTWTVHTSRRQLMFFGGKNLDNRFVWSKDIGSLRSQCCKCLPWIGRGSLGKRGSSLWGCKRRTWTRNDWFSIIRFTSYFTEGTDRRVLLFVWVDRRRHHLMLLMMLPLMQWSNKGINGSTTSMIVSVVVDDDCRPRNLTSTLFFQSSMIWHQVFITNDQMFNDVGVKVI